MTQKMIFKSAVRALLLVCGVQAGPASATYFTAEYVRASVTPATPATPATSPMPTTGSKAPGLYVSVMDGQITVSNSGGTANFTAGQFGYTSSSSTPPVMLPTNPGIQFSPPPAFSSTTVPGASSSAGSSGSVDCVVR